MFNTTTPSLRPCPFCSGLAELSVDSQYVACGTCGACGPSATTHDPVAVWNDVARRIAEIAQLGQSLSNVQSINAQARNALKDLGFVAPEVFDLAACIRKLAERSKGLA